MKFKEWFKGKQSKMEELRQKDSNSSQKKIEVANDIIEMMRDFNVERRILNSPFEGLERRHG